MSEQPVVTPEEILEALVEVFYHKARRILAHPEANWSDQQSKLESLSKDLNVFIGKVGQKTDEGVLDFTACYNDYYIGCPTGGTPCNENQFWICLSGGLL